ncbi:hypothetical protein B0I35DRAFT_506453 [Stachybotrys elegans]|uniref:RanBD1 domain-containing protein n=1 Tax=Stachybotrys elegans TaxID=80388 RepID=A0A8K0T5R4_9HYPO|nr:hypothetical protein B0I35DRAFT_506453 [Stachybotrys elegans]
MADETQDASPRTEPVPVQVKEDAETRAARRELKQSSLSDESPTHSAGDNADRPETPADDAANDANDDDLREQVSSPKKKRAHDQLDGEKEVEENDATSVASTDSGRDRSTRLEPEKKRHRDELPNEDATKATDADTSAKETADEAAAPTSKQPQTSASAFAASGFGKLATGSSPFASLGGAKGSVFGAGAPSLSSFASPSTSTVPVPTAAPKLTFGGSAAQSPFAGLASKPNGFGSATGGAFGSALAGIKPLQSFAAPGAKPIQSEKPAKPFGAPDSDAEEDDDDAEDEESQPDDVERAVSPEKETEEKKRLKLQRVEVDDGEAGETTILSVRTKMYYHDREAGWKERGAGMLKINVPTPCVEFDDSDVPIPGSFDASAMEAADDGEDGDKSAKVVRLVMRQDQTHRVILNTALLPAMEFQEKASLKSVGILFTAFEGPDAKPVSVTMKMTAANAKAFMSELKSVQRELQGN